MLASAVTLILVATLFGYLVDASGHWYPNLFDRQLEVFNARARMLLVAGPRKSGKTLAVLHKIVRHMWETPGARVAMFSKTLKKSKAGGTWDDLHKIVLPEWIKANIGLRYTTKDSEGVPGWKVDGATRVPYFKITNAHGGESELMLFSLDYDADVENRVKEQRFSMVYFSELASFTDRRVLSVTVQQLRMVHLKMEEQQWIADTNPSEEGPESWIYKVWYLERNMSYDEYTASCAKDGIPPMTEEEFTLFRSGLELIEIRPEENPFLDPRELVELKASCSYDRGLYARHVEGKWEWGEGDSSRHFRALFHRAVHVSGNADSANEQEWELLNPSPNCVELITGWDIGDVNHAAGILERVMVNEMVRDRNGQNVLTEVSHFSILAECTSLKSEVSIDEFTEAMMEQIESLEETAGRKFRLDRAWSDRSAIEKYNAAADTFQYLVVYDASNHRIYLQGVPKPRYSVKTRVALLKKLLHQKRLHISANCTEVIKMFKDLKKGKTALTFVLPEDPLKHTFDWLTYALLMECAEELENRPDGSVGNRIVTPSGLVVSVR